MDAEATVLSRRRFLAAAGAFAGSALRIRAQPSPRPRNLVLIVADDLGWRDLGCYGSKYYRTPNIDRLAREGMRFTSAYACPNCAPTRASLLTGLYGPRTGIYTVGGGDRGREEFRKMTPAPNRTNLAPSQTTFAEALKPAGYTTAHIGKWHMGKGDFLPTRQGFDVNIAGNESGAPRSYFSPYRNPNLPDGPDGQYLTDRLSLEAVRFLTAHQHTPFALYLCFYSVHTPIQPRPDLHERWKTRQPDGGQSNAAYAAMVESLDRGVGRVLDALDDLRLADSTALLFCSDNGGVGGYRRAGVDSRDITDNHPLRGGKGMLYEGGIRVPLLARCPLLTPAGAACDDPVMCVDYFPTLLELAGVRPPEDLRLDGTSFFPQIREGGGSGGKRPPIYWHFPGYLEGNQASGAWRTTPGGAIRDGDYKLIEFFETGTLELYNLREDLSETTDLAASRPEIVRDLHAKLTAWRKRMNAPMPVRKA